MRIAALSSNSQQSGGLLQDAYALGPSRDANEGYDEEILTAEIADFLNRKARALHQAPLGSLRSRRTSLDDIACGQGFVWFPQPFVDVEGGDLPRVSRLVSDVLLEKAEHERRRARARARRAWSWLLVLAIGVGTLAVFGTQDSPNALQFMGIEFAQLLNTESL
jgi:hypothetical protein